MNTNNDFRTFNINTNESYLSYPIAQTTRYQNTENTCEQEENSPNTMAQRKTRNSVLISDIVLVKRLYLRSVKVNEIALDSNLSTSAVYKIITDLKDNDMNEELVANLKKRPGPKRFENMEFLQGVGQAIQHDPCYTQNGIVQRMASNNIHISQSTVSKTLKKLDLTRKRVKKVAHRTIEPDVIAQRKAYSINIRTIPVNRLCFLDETGVNLHTTARFGYSPKNTPCTSIVNSDKGKNISFLVLINNNTILNYCSVEGAFNSDVFFGFILHCIDHGFIRTDNYIVMDNCRIHKNPRMLSYLASRNFNILFLPPYSPQLNPIEEVFSLVKSRYHQKRPKATNSTEIQINMFEVMEDINNDISIMISRYYDHMQHYLDLAFTGSIFD